MPFRIGITRSLLDRQGKPIADIGLRLLDEHSNVEWEFMAEDAAVLSAHHVHDYDAIVVASRAITADTIAGAEPPVLIARLGVGYDSVDVPACTERGVILTITPDGVRRPMASSCMAFILALGHQLMRKDRMTREGRWADADRYEPMGAGLVDRVLGLVGMGNIGREVFKLAKPFEMRHIAYDPYITEQDAAPLGVELVDLQTLMRTSDFICICCPLNDATYRLIDAERLALMKQTAFLINVARGHIVDQAALTTALREKRIRGAALDVFDREPTDPDDPILSLENVIVTPHAICETDQFWQGIGRSAFSNVVDVAAGRVPKHVVNRAVLDHSRVKEKLRGYAARGRGGISR